MRELQQLLRVRIQPVLQLRVPQQALRRVHVRCSLPVPDAPRGCARRVRRSAGLEQMQPRRAPELRELQALQRALREPQRQAPQPSEPLQAQPG